MPAVARKTTPDSYRNYQSASAQGVPASAPPRAAAAPPRHRRWQEDPQRQAPPSSRRRPSRPRRVVDDAEDWRGLVDHFHGEQAERLEQARLEMDTRRAQRRRERLRHRPFRMTLLATAMLGAPLALLACLLGMRSNALALSREDAALQNKIAAMRFDLQNTRREIAALNSSPHIEQWARARGWQQAGQQDFDDVSKVVNTTGNVKELSSEAP